MEFHFLVEPVQHASEDRVRVRAAEVDHAAGVPAEQPGDGNLQNVAGERLALSAEVHGHQRAAGTPNREHTFLLRIQVDQPSAFQVRHVQRLSAVHAGLFVCREDAFERRGGELFIIQSS